MKYSQVALIGMNIFLAGYMVTKSQKMQLISLAFIWLIAFALFDMDERKKEQQK